MRTYKLKKKIHEKATTTHLCVADGAQLYTCAGIKIQKLIAIHQLRSLFALVLFQLQVNIA